MLDFTIALIALRTGNPALRPPWFRQASGGNGPDFVHTYRSDAQPFSDDDWHNADARSIIFLLEHDGADAFALLMNAAENGVEFTVPDAPNNKWQLAVSSDPHQKVHGPVHALIVRDVSFTLLRSRVPQRRKRKSSPAH